MKFNKDQFKADELYQFKYELTRATYYLVYQGYNESRQCHFFSEIYNKTKGYEYTQYILSHLKIKHIEMSKLLRILLNYAE